MKVLRFYILYRLPIAILLTILGIVSHILGDPILAWILYVIAFFSFLFYFMMGTMRLVQESVAEGDVDKAMEYMKKIHFPRLLFKPIRVTYYMLQSNLSFASNDLGKAEENIKKSINTKSTIVGNVQGTNLMQLGFIQLKQGKTKEARQSLLDAVKHGISDKESLAAVYLQLSSIEIQRSQNRVGKEYFKRAKALKPKSEELQKQIKLMEKNINRLPG